MRNVDDYLNKPIRQAEVQAPLRSAAGGRAVSDVRLSCISFGYL